MLNLSIIKTMNNIYDYKEYITRLGNAEIIPPKELYAMHLGIYLVAMYEHPELSAEEARLKFYEVQPRNCCGGSNNVL